MFNLSSLRPSRLILFGTLFALMAAIALVAAQPAAAQGQVVVNSEDSLTEVPSITGNYEVTFGAIGLEGVPGGTILIDSPGTPVEVILMWTARSVTNDGDDTVTVNINGDGDQTIVADKVWRFDSNTVCCDDHAVYLSQLDAASFNQGNNTVAFADFGDNGNIGEPHGASVTLTSEDAAFAEATITRYEGLDSFFFDWEGVFGPNSQTVCQEFASSDVPRPFEFTYLVGGVDGNERPNRIWYTFGSGAPVNTVVDAGTSIDSNNVVPSEYPFYGSHTQNGEQEYDLFEYGAAEGLFVPPGATYVCFQVESWDDPTNNLPASMLVHGLVTYIADPGTTAISLGGFQTAESGPAAGVWIALLAAVAITSVVILRRRNLLSMVR